MHTLYIFGGSSTAIEIGEAASAMGSCEPYFVVPSDEPFDGDRRICIDTLADHCAGRDAAGFIVSMSNLSVRKNCQQIAQRLELTPHSVIHPLALVSASARVDAGTYVAAHCIVSSNAWVGPHCVLNFQVLVGHDTTLGEHCRLNPGAKIGGNCVIGERTMIGANSFVYQGTHVGEDAVIDAMTSVRNDLAARHIISQNRNEGKPLRRPML